jgi:hypothetical protein
MRELRGKPEKRRKKVQLGRHFSGDREAALAAVRMTTAIAMTRRRREREAERIWRCGFCE